MRILRTREVTRECCDCLITLCCWCCLLAGATRSDAVWLTLALEFVAKQLKSGEAKDTDVLSIVSMNNTSRVLVDKQPVDWILYNRIIGLLRSEMPKEGGNYLPAMQQVGDGFVDEINIVCMLE